MEDDYGQEAKIFSVTVPLSLIHALTFEMIYVIDQWHEDRSINDVDTEKCFAAMMAATEAVLEMLHEDGHGETLQ